MSALQTDRLTLVPWPAERYEAIAALTQDPRVMRFIGDGSLWEADFIAGVAEKQQRYWDTVGYGWRIAVRKTDGEAIAMAASCPVGDGVPDLDPSEHELGWWVAAEAWRQGYGSEIALALRAEAHEVHGSAEVLARLQPENLGSAGVAKAIGLTYSGDIRGRLGEPNAVYRGPAEGWRSLSLTQADR